MKKFRNITILLIIIVLLPVFFYSGLEIVRMKKTEKELEAIYTKQLDAILFSINLYCEDIISDWASKIRDKASLKNNEVADIIGETASIQSITIYNETSNHAQVFTLDSSLNKQDIANQVITLSKTYADKIKKLASYYKSGYYKTEPIVTEHNFFVYFLIPNGTDFDVSFVEIKPEDFINFILVQRIQSIAENKINIGVYDIISQQNTFTTPDFKATEEYNLKKQLWLFPQYEIGIQLKEKSIAELSSESNKFNIKFIIFTDLVFVIAAFMVYRNIRKELRLTQIKSEFVSNVSHEIRTPLALISMYAETLEMDRVKTDEKRKEYYRVIFNETQRLSGIVNKILNFSKTDSGKRQFNFVETDVNQLVTKVMETYSFHLKSKGFESEIKLTENLPTIMADNEAIAEVLINLIDNAIKYSTDTKRVEISTSQSSNMVCISLKDHGIGIAAEHQKLIFDKFYRVTKGHLALQAKGTGLGLSIVKSIIDTHKGKIEVESKPSQGSTFTITLPAKTI